MMTSSPIECRVGDIDVRITGRVLKTARLRSEYYVQLRDPELLIKHVKHSGVRSDIVTFIQDICDPRPRYPFYHEGEQMAALPITTYDDWVTKQLYNKPRNMLRKALKSGVEIRLEDFTEPVLRGIKAVYDETPIRQGRRNRHYMKSIETLRREHATLLDRSQFICAYYAGDFIGFAKVTFCEGFGIVMNFLSKVSCRGKAPNNAILAKAVEICALRQLNFLVYGVWGSAGSRGLTEFKVANGFHCVEVPRYFVPLTRLGRIALAMGVHQGIIRRLPRWCLETAARFREGWNSFTWSSPFTAPKGRV